jgi:hypothetical protein
MELKSAAVEGHLGYALRQTSPRKDLPHNLRLLCLALANHKGAYLGV